MTHGMLRRAEQGGPGGEGEKREREGEQRGSRADNGGPRSARRPTSADHPHPQKRIHSRTHPSCQSSSIIFHTRFAPSFISFLSTPTSVSASSS